MNNHVFSRVPNKNGLEKISRNIFIMDNHKWAYYIWWKYRNIIPNILLHLDYHWDGIDSFQYNKGMLKIFQKFDNSKMYSFIKKDKYIREDSFITPALITNIFKEVHFLCFQNDTDIGIDESLLDNYNAKQFLYNSSDEVVNSLSNQSIVFDLDLDIFNKSDYHDTGDLWKENEIIDFLGRFIKIIKRAPIITIAYSYSYSGSKKDTNYLANLVIPIILKCTNNQ